MASSTSALGAGTARSGKTSPGSVLVSSSSRKCSVCGEDGHTKRHHTTPAEPVPSEDRYTEELLRRRYTSFREFYSSGLELKDELGIRMTNMPEDISENITKFIIRNHCGVESYWARHVHKTGDLWSPTENVQENKCFMSDGPMSFGPEKTWDVLYCLDLRKWMDDILVLHRTTLTPAHEQLQNIRMCG